VLATVLDFLDRYPSLTDPDDDLEDKIERLLIQASALMALFCGWPQLDDGSHSMESGAVTLYPSPAMGRPKALDHGLRWVTAQAAYIDADWVYGSAVSASDLQQDNQKGLLWLKPSSEEAWSYAERGNKVVLTNGFVATPDGDGYSTAPAAIVAICVMVARHLYDQGQSQGLQSYSVGDRSATLADDVGLLLPKAAQMALEPYKIDPPYPQRELSHGC
jgi:hypothetical protein